MNGTSADRSGERTFRFFVCFATVISLAFYGPYLNNFFAGDDFLSLETLMKGPATVLVGYDNNLRIVSNAMWWPLYALFQLDPLGYNLFSLALYLLNGILLYRLLDRLFLDRQVAFLAAAIFVCSGAGADAVFWRAANATLLSTTLYFIALDTYVCFRRLKQRKYYLASLIVFLLAINTKEQAASLPAIIVVLEVLVFREREGVRQTVNRMLPYLVIIAAYLLANYFIIHQLLHAKSFMAGIAKVRPLYSLFGGMTAFFISPAGALPNQAVIYVTAVLVPVSFFLVSDKKLLLVGYLWVIVTFLPQSLSGQADFEVKLIYNSLSRQLYLPSVGSALVFAVLLISLRERLTLRPYLVTCCLFLAIYAALQGTRVHDRGKRWKFEGDYVARFIQEMRKVLPELPENTYISITYPPVGRAFTQSALRVFYGKKSIYWREGVEELMALTDGNFPVFINYNWEDNWRYGSPATVYVLKSRLGQLTSGGTNSIQH